MIRSALAVALAKSGWKWIFYIIYIITTVFKQLKYKRLKTVRSGLIMPIM